MARKAYKLHLATIIGFENQKLVENTMRLAECELYAILADIAYSLAPKTKSDRADWVKLKSLEVLGN